MIGLFFPNRATTAGTYSGGSWLAALPVANVGDPALAKVARSTDATIGSTKIRLDQGSARALRAFALVNHNLSAAAQWRVLLGTTSGGSEVYAGTLADWLQATGFEAGLTARGMEDGEYLRDGTHALIVLPAFYTARHVTIEITDTANANGYVQVGRIFVGGGFVPTINASYGLQHGWKDLSTKEQAESGADWVTARRRMKKAQFVLDGTTEAEGEQLYEMQRVIGTIDEALYVPDLVQIGVSQRYGFLGSIAEMSAIEYPYYERHRLPLSMAQKG